MKPVLLILVMLTLCVLKIKASEEDCYSDNKWSAFMYDDKLNTYLNYYPYEFFTANGAAIPDYIPDSSYQHPYFQLTDTTCQSDDWYIGFETRNYGQTVSTSDTTIINSYVQTVMGIDVFTPPSLEGLRSSGKKRITVVCEDTIRQKGPLKNYWESTSTLGFRYKNGVLYFLKNGWVYQTQHTTICKIANPVIYWECLNGDYGSGGEIVSFTYADYANDSTIITEDFTDCSNQHTFLDCEPDPEVTLESSFEAPDCHNDYLYLHAQSNLLTNYHWYCLENPKFTSTQKDPIIDFSGNRRADTLHFVVWGQTDTCHAPVIDTVTVPIPKLVTDTTQSVDRCHGQDLVVGDYVHTESGIYVDTLVNASGCDSIVTSIVNLSYKEDAMEDSLCVGGKYVFGSRVITEPGLYSDTLKTLNGCDSIINIDLKQYKIETEVFDTIYLGYIRHFGDLNLTSDGEYSQTFRTAGGCDSMVVLHLQTKTITKEVTDTICVGKTYYVGDFPHTQAGDYIDTLFTPEGFDSIVTLHLHTIQVSGEVYDTICVGHTYAFGNDLLTEAGDYTLHTQTAEGCDSITTLHLSTYQIENEIYDTICIGSTYHFGTQSITEKGSYTETFKTADGCDSIVTLHLTTYQVEGVVYDTICVGSTYQFGNQLLTTAGDYTLHTQTAENCDSITTLHLTTYQIESEVYDTMCVGNTYHFGTQEITKKGTYTETFKTADGCDSIVTLYLTTYQVEGVVYDTICVGSTYQFGDQFLTGAGDYTLHTQTAEGCDSITTLHLTTFQIKDEVYDTMCIGSTYHFGTQEITKKGTYTETFKTAGGCDSIVILHLTTYQVEGVVYDTMCVGSTYHFGDLVITKAGNYHNTLKTIGGCDSIVTLHLTTYQVEGIVYDTICVGSTYQFGAQNLTTAGTYTLHTQTAENCDSITTLHLYTYQIENEVYDTMCVGNTYSFGSQNITKKGTYKETFKTNDECDSIVTLHLYTYQVTEEVYDTICYGSNYSFGDKIYSKSGVYNKTVKTNDGCDSTVYLHLTVLPKINPTNISLSICSKDSITYNGHTFKRAGTYTDHLTNQWGCDSVVNYNVSELAEGDTSVIYRICRDSSITLNGITYTRDTVFHDVVKFDDRECPIKTKVRIYTSPVIDIADRNVNLCGVHTKQIYIDSIFKATYQWIPAEGVSNAHSRTPFVTIADSQQYKVVVKAKYCTDTVNVNIISTPMPIIDKVSVDKDGTNLEINVSEGTQPYYYQIDTTTDWHSSVDFGPLTVGVHNAWVRDDAGCLTNKYFHYFIPIIPAPYMTPNGDGKSDTWEIKNLEYYHEYVIKIFDRFGKLLVEYKNEYPGWDGVYKGNPMPTTDYWYTISVDFIDYSTSGHFTLLR